MMLSIEVIISHLFVMFENDLISKVRAAIYTPEHQVMPTTQFRQLLQVSQVGRVPRHAGEAGGAGGTDTRFMEVNGVLLTC